MKINWRECIYGCDASFSFPSFISPITTRQWSFSGHCHSLNNISNAENYPQSTIKIDHHHNVNKNRAWNIVNKVWKCVKTYAHCAQIHTDRHTHTYVFHEQLEHEDSSVCVYALFYIYKRKTLKEIHIK